MTGWGLIAATVIVLSNLAGIAVEFLFLLIAQLTGNAAIADLAFNPIINVVVCLLFMLGATLVSYRDMQTTQKFQYILVGFQVLVLVVFATVAIVKAVSGDAPEPTAFSWSWFNPF
ncbi:amino acid transporter, partial [Pseudomonas sp. BGM005]|nr:amino acid transporter [Pseudomonas sp. BG5]